MKTVIKPDRVDKTVLEDRILYQFVFSAWLDARNYRSIFLKKLKYEYAEDNVFYVSTISTTMSEKTKKYEYIFDFILFEDLLLNHNSLEYDESDNISYFQDGIQDIAHMYPDTFIKPNNKNTSVKTPDVLGVNYGVGGFTAL